MWIECYYLGHLKLYKAGVNVLSHYQVLVRFRFGMDTMWSFVFAFPAPPNPHKHTSCLQTATVSNSFFTSICPWQVRTRAPLFYTTETVPLKYITCHSPSWILSSLLCPEPLCVQLIQWAAGPQAPPLTELTVAIDKQLAVTVEMLCCIFPWLQTLDIFYKLPLKSSTSAVLINLYPVCYKKTQSSLAAMHAQTYLCQPSQQQQQKNRHAQ